MKQILLTLLTTMLCFVGVNAQENRGVPFNGEIKDFLGNPLRKAKVYVDARFQSLSDRKGRFGLTDVKDDDTIKVVYQKKIYFIPVEGKKSLKIKIADQVDKVAMIEAEEDRDLVNIGYGYVKRRESLDVSSGITGEIVRRTNASNVLDALRGLVPGLTFFYDKGKTRVLIRGRGTNSDKTDPLFLVDGVEVEDLSNISVYDVEHVEVLKDASMYGCRGANGAIIVRTIGTGPFSN